MTVITRAPTSDEYTSGGWTGGWADVDDYPDQVSTMSGTVYTAATKRFGFTAFDVPAGSTAITVTMRIWHFDTGSGACAFKPCLKVNGTQYDHGTVIPTYGDAVNNSASWATNPDTAAAWTVADVNGSGSNPLQAFGIQVTDNTPTIQIASIQLEVEYTEGAPAGTARSQVIIIGG